LRIWKEPFCSEPGDVHDGEGENRLSEETARSIEQQALGIFSKSFSKRHEFWSKKDILLIALQTLPKQVKKKNRLDNFLKMRREFLEKLVEES
jgi:hypothetical protein